jgi:sarcosine oxidase, subunit delta
MLSIRCPYCLELRTDADLVFGHEAGVSRPADPALASDDEWTNYLYMRANHKGVSEELWCCAHGCGQWFLVSRDSLTHVVTSVRPLALAVHELERP